MTKGIELLKDIKENLNNIDNEYGFNLRSEIEEIKTDCKLIEEELKALSLLKDILIVEKEDSYGEATYWLKTISLGYYIKQLTKEGYDSLKEVLKK